MVASDTLIAKLRQHSRLDSGDVSVLRKLTYHVREIRAAEDFISQGEACDASSVVLEGCVARYHTFAIGRSAVPFGSSTGRLARCSEFVLGADGPFRLRRGCSGPVHHPTRRTYKSISYEASNRICCMA